MVMAMSFALTLTAFVQAADTIQGAPQEPMSVLDKIGAASGLTSFAGKYHRLSNVAPGADAITSIVYFTIDFFKYLFGGIAIVYAIISGIKLITAAKKIDEVSEKEKENMKYIIYGLLLVMIADQLVSKVFFGEYGECIASASNAQACAQAGGSLIRGMYGLILTVLGTVSLFIVVLAGFRLVTSYGEEETIAKEKKRITMAMIGLLVSGVGEFVVKGIVFPDGGTKGIDVAAAQKLVLSFTNFIAAFIGAGSFLMLFYAGYLYVAGAGNEEQTGKAKKIIIGAIIGILIAFAAYGVVATVTSFSSGRTIALPTNVPGLP